MKPKYPIYIVSKGRYESRHTMKALDLMNASYYVVIEEQEYDLYAQYVNKSRLLVLDKKSQDEYNTFDDLGDSKSKGPGAARNFAWEHSINLGVKRHWVMDDNIYYFVRINHNRFAIIKTSSAIRSMEDFVDRYENVLMAGPNYFKFVDRSAKVPAYTLNTRIYSCNLIKNDIPYRWRGRYNEDTDLSLRMLKDNWCTIQFNAFLQEKITTQNVRGGNTEAFYAKEGTLPKSQMLKDMHSDVTRVVWKFNRWHHEVDYRPFKNNILIKRKDYIEKKGVNNYGMKLVNTK